MTMKTNEILASLRSLSLEDLSTINKSVCDVIRSKGRENAQNFRVGDLVKFQSKNRGIIYGRISRFLTKNVELRECTPKDTNVRLMTWRVSPGLLKAWDGKDPFANIEF